jgi:hypothetical protein
MLEDRQDIIGTLRRIEAAARQNDLPFVVSSAELIREAMEREEI